MHIDYDAFISAANEMIASGSGDYYIGLFCGLLYVVSAVFVWLCISCCSSFLGWLLSRFGKPLFEKKRKKDQ